MHKTLQVSLVEAKLQRPGRRGRVLAVAAVIAAFSLGGCATTGSVPEVTLNKRANYQEKVDNVIFVIKTDGIPKEFSDALVADIGSVLSGRNVKVDVRPVSSLDLDSITKDQISKFKFLMTCVPAEIYSNQYTLQSIKMNCTLVDVARDIVVMKADATAYKGWGWGFGTNEADHLSKELVKKMEEAGLLSPPPTTISAA